MLVESVDVEGMADLLRFSTGPLERITRFKGPDPASVALGDALELFFAALSPVHLRRLLARWQLLVLDEEPDLIVEPFPDQARWSTAAAGSDLVADPKTRAISVTAALRLDPVLFRGLRAEAARHPRLVTALSSGPVVTITVGALFASTFDALALSVNTVQIGEERFPTLDAERPAWLTRLLLALGPRFHRYTPDPHTVASWAMAAATSRDRFPAYTAWQQALAERLGVVRVALGAGGAPTLLVNERPVWRWGDHGARTAALAAAVHLSNADVLWAESEDPILAEGIEQGALEQVLLLGPGGERAVQPPPPRPKATAFRARGAR